MTPIKTASHNIPKYSLLAGLAAQLPDLNCFVRVKVDESAPVRRSTPSTAEARDFRARYGNVYYVLDGAARSRHF